jgi:hypothetical protein
MSGYAQRVLTLPFPELSDDPDGDLIWITIRNPKLVPPGELTPDQDTPIVDGMPANPEAAVDSMHRILAKLIVGWHVYDATQDVELDAAGNDVTVPRLLPNEKSAFTAANSAKLPTAIITEITKKISGATNPQ